MPGIQRTTGSVVFPGGGGPQIGVPGVPMQGLGFTQFTNNVGINGLGFGAGTLGSNNPNFSNGRNWNGNGNWGGNGNGNGDWKGGRRRNNNSVVYAYPVFVGGGYYGGYYGGDYSDPSGYGAVPPDVQSQFQGLPQQQQPNVIVILPQGQAPQGAPVPQSQSLYQPPAAQQPAMDTSGADEQATHYLIAFKDHTVYSAVAYWVDGDTLHYFTTGNTHNQASLSLVDRALTEKLNKDSGLEVKLPPLK